MTTVIHQAKQELQEELMDVLEDMTLAVLIVLTMFVWLGPGVLVIG